MPLLGEPKAATICRYLPDRVAPAGCRDDAGPVLLEGGYALVQRARL
jgi:hypothetical protein